MHERIVMLGGGAVGGYVGGHLALHGADVTLLDFWPEHIDAIRKNGLELSGMTQEERKISHPKIMHLYEAAALAKLAPRGYRLHVHEVLQYRVDGPARQALSCAHRVPDSAQ
jgi:ketopantoate reductase